jgi:hypothetical protein
MTRGLLKSDGLWQGQQHCPSLKSTPAFELLDLHCVAVSLLRPCWTFINDAQFPADWFRGQAAMQAENIALRHQLTVLQRTQKPKRPVLKPLARCLGVWLSRLWSRWAFSTQKGRPEHTIVMARRRSSYPTAGRVATDSLYRSVSPGTWQGLESHLLSLQLRL